MEVVAGRDSATVPVMVIGGAQQRRVSYYDMQSVWHEFIPYPGLAVG
jgi:hypothetical protein